MANQQFVAAYTPCLGFSLSTCYLLYTVFYIVKITFDRDISLNKLSVIPYYTITLMLIASMLQSIC